MRSFLILVSLCLMGLSANSQCTLTIESTTGYEVHIELTNLTVNAPTSCPFGYNYTVSIDYNISFTGPGAPSSLWTLQGDIDCDNPNLSFSLPNSGGTGTTTSSNAFRNMTDCASATSSSLNCNNIDLTIQGPGISTQTISCALGVVPIALVNFSVENKRDEIHIAWDTERESNNDFFTLERSSDSNQWQKVIQVESVGFSEVPKSYAAIDDTPLLGTSYYRLKQTDLDGQFSYSEILSFKLNSSKVESFKIYPNPVNDHVYIDRYDDQTSTIDVFDAIGNRLTTDLNISQDGSISSIDLSALATGIYFIRIGTENVKVYKL